jgi:amino acid adenylation domain-containing protein
MLKPSNWPSEFQPETIPARFAAVAGSAPEQVAIDLLGEQLPYAELDRASNRLGHGLLNRLGEGRLPIGIFLPASFQQFIAYLGILKSGNICLPLGPHNPEGRLEEIFDEIQPAAVITNRQAGAPLYALDPQPTGYDVNELIGDGDDTMPAIAINPSDPAAIYLTSGSTGEPKGVVRSHETMLHHAWVYSTDQGIQSDDRQSYLYSPQSGASMPDLLGAFLSGATLLPFEPRQHSIARFADWLRSGRASILHTPIPLFRLLLDELGPDEVLESLQTVLAGGEAVFRQDILRGRRHVSPECIFVHQLASTETNYIARYFIRSDTPLEEQVLPVGSPARDKTVLIQGSNGRILDPGEVGEIVVQSRYLSEGYWKDDLLTASRFQPMPAQADHRTFRTGDLGVFEPDGMLRYRGREDRQVRVRGHRVELPVVEAALQALPGVRLAAVAARPRPAGDQMLTAYVVPDDPASPPALDTIREQLGRSLPEHVLPSALVCLEQFPVLASGKIDKRALPPAGETRPPLESDYQPARDIYEARLIRIWEQVLGIRPIGARDTFFGLGGNSLQAMRLLARIADEMGEDLPQASLLQAPTIEQQAILLRTERSDRPQARVVAIQTGGSLRPFFCISPRVVDVLAYRALALELGEDQPFYALYNVDLPPASNGKSQVMQEADAFIDDVLRIDPDGPYQLGGYSHGGIVALEIAHRLIERGKQVSVVVLLDVYGPGYRRPLPLLPRWSYRPLQMLRSIERSVSDFLPWATHHLQLIARLSWSDRGYYLTRKLVNRLRWWRSRAGRTWTRLTSDDVETNKQVLRPVGGSFRDHSPRTYPGRVALFRASRQPLGIMPDPQLGWGGFLNGPLDIVEVPGFHDSILFGPRIRTLARYLKAHLTSESALVRPED